MADLYPLERLGEIASLSGLRKRRARFGLASTGWGQQEDRELAHAAGFDRHLVKPVDPQVLRTLLTETP